MIFVLFFIRINIFYNDNVVVNYYGKVISIKENYYIVKVDKSLIILYSDINLNYFDKITFEGEYTKIYTPKSKSSFSFENYANKLNVFYQIKAKNIKIEKSSNSFLSRLYTKIKEHPNSIYLNKILLNINHSEIKEDLLFISISYGVIHKSLIVILNNVLNKLLYKKESFIILMFLYLLSLIIFKQYAFILNVMLYKLLNQSDLERSDQISICIVLILLLFPNYLFSLSFIIVTLYRTISFISIKKYKVLLNILILCPISLISFYKCNLFEIILYPLYKTYGIFIYLFAIVDTYFNTNFVMFMLKFKQLNINFLTFSGHMNILILFMWIFISLLLLNEFKYYYVICLFLILIINQNQLLFSPFFSYTQLYIGQGDSAIIKYPFKNDVILIDTGSPSNYSKLYDHLNYYGIKNIHSLIISHDDLDHSGNIDILVSNFKVNEIVINEAVVNYYGLNIYNVKYEFDNDNDSSLITYFQINNYIYLLLGDISKNVEERFLIDYPHIKANIIKLAHHGSDTSSSDSLLKLDSIKLIINSSGYNNMYNHPHFNVLKRIYDYSLAFLDTQNVGDIEIKHFFQYNFISY